MHIPTHLFSGWCAANLPPEGRLGPRERFFCVLAATLPDVDGVGIFYDERLYFDYHHVIGHNVFFGAGVAALLAAMARPPEGGWHRGRLFALFFALFHLHLLMDAFGSGPDWPTYYLWPLSPAAWSNPWGWTFDDPRNYLAALLLIVWTIRIYRVRRRGPLEYPWPWADGIFVRLFPPGTKTARDAARH